MVITSMRIHGDSVREQLWKRCEWKWKWKAAKPRSSEHKKYKGNKTNKYLVELVDKSHKVTEEKVLETEGTNNREECKRCWMVNQHMKESLARFDYLISWFTFPFSDWISICVFLRQKVLHLATFSPYFPRTSEFLVSPLQVKCYVFTAEVHCRNS